MSLTHQIYQKFVNTIIKKIWPYLVGAVMVVFIFGWVYGRRFSLDMNNLFTTPGDLWSFASVIKGLINGEWYPFLGVTMKHIGAPFSPVYFSIDYPMPEQLQYLFMKIIGIFTKNPFLVINLYYVFSFILIQWTAIFACRTFNISRGVSLVVGTLFAFLPYHAGRYGHALLAAYYLIPLAAVIILKQWSIKPFFKVNHQASSIWGKFDRKTWFAIIVSLLIGWWHIYYAFFFCFFIVIAGISSAVYRRSWKHVLGMGIIIGIVIGSLGIVAIPTIYGRMVHGKNTEALLRYPFESELYGLKLTNLVMPRNNPLSVLRKFNEKYKSGTHIVEGYGEYIGIAAIFGLFVSLGGFLLIRSRPTLIFKIGMLTSAGLIYASVGGLAALFALITPMIRCPNRISPYLAFWGLLLLAFMLQKLKIKLWKHPVLFQGILIVVCIWGVLDQTWGWQFNPPSNMFASNRKFFHAIEKTVSSGSVLQLPYLAGPEHTPLYEMDDGNSHFRAFLFTERINWSYGAMMGRHNAKKIEALSQTPLNMENLRKTGYVGIFIDRFGFENRHCADETQLRGTSKIEPIESDDKRFVFYKI